MLLLLLVVLVLLLLVVYRRTVNDGDALWADDISPDDVVVGVSNIPFSTGQEIVEEVTGRPYRR